MSEICRLAWRGNVVSAMRTMSLECTRPRHVQQMVTPATHPYYSSIADGVEKRKSIFDANNVLKEMNLVDQERMKLFQATENPVAFLRYA